MIHINPKPKVHALVSAVAQPLVVNSILASGAEAYITSSRREIEEFVSTSHALLLNMGDWSQERRYSAESALNQANSQSLPVVIDPVGIQNSCVRRKDFQELAAGTSNLLVKSNQEEWNSFLEVIGVKKLLDEDVFPPLKQVFPGLRVWVVTGKKTIIYGEGWVKLLPPGSKMMKLITGMGCALGGVIATYLAQEEDYKKAVIQALDLWHQASRQGEKQSRGPGSFTAEFLDALAELSPWSCGGEKQRRFQEVSRES